jgi:AcrR family transcriptional regulator
MFTKKNTKSKIISAARQLFNERGFSNVTIRTIALEVHMSSGNLNYHFKTREEILEALYFEMVEEFDARIEQLGDQEITLETVARDMYKSLERMLDYRFFWTDLYNLLRLNSKMKTHFKSVYSKRWEGYEILFQYLTQKGILKKFEWPIEKQFLIERMIEVSNTWLYNSCIYDIDVNNDYLRQQTNNLLMMLFPYLTDLGESQFKELKLGIFK